MIPTICRQCGGSIVRNMFYADVNLNICEQCAGHSLEEDSRFFTGEPSPMQNSPMVTLARNSLKTKSQIWFFAS